MNNCSIFPQIFFFLSQDHIINEKKELPTKASSIIVLMIWMVMVVVLAVIKVKVIKVKIYK